MIPRALSTPALMAAGVLALTAVAVVLVWGAVETGDALYPVIEQLREIGR